MSPHAYKQLTPISSTPRQKHWGHGATVATTLGK